MPGEDYLALQERMGRVKDLHSAMGLLSWDQEVYMPPKAAPARGQQLATLAAIAHRMFTDKEVGELLARLGAETTLGPDESKLVEETRYDYDRATRLPEAFVQKFTEECSKAYEAWVRAKDENDFEAFRPNLESIVDLSKQKADLMGYEGSPYNALLEDYERGMTAEGLRPIFSELAERLGRLVERIVASDRGPDTRWLDTDWDRDAQWDFTQRILRDMGYDFEAGRQDESVHPFTTNFDLYDVRLTTKINTKDPFEAIMASIHEGGHGLYEQGFLPSDRHTILAEPISLGIHESQSRLWETLIGQSRAFWAHYGDVLREAFPEQLKNVSNDDIHRVVNRVRPTLRRLDADECTYNLHIILRFEIEVALIEG
ncbi:MAG: carboxypeptidase M32, partial [Candidatus Hydrogenedentes bacterium]|nr:carboxypeptidase M32 [Candidatus Hydrogenedentota bacterium]